MISTEVVSPAASASASSAAVLRITARPRGCAGRRTAAAPAPAHRTAPARRSGTGRTTSSRKTLVSGSAWEVGGTSSPATPLIEATDSRITDSCGARWSSSASARSIRARFARCATSSRVMSGMGSILGESPRGVSPRPSGLARPVGGSVTRASGAACPSVACRGAWRPAVPPVSEALGCGRSGTSATVAWPGSPGFEPTATSTARRREPWSLECSGRPEPGPPSGPRPPRRGTRTRLPAAGCRGRGCRGARRPRPGRPGPGLPRRPPRRPARRRRRPGHRRAAVGRGAGARAGPGCWDGTSGECYPRKALHPFGRNLPDPGLLKTRGSRTRATYTPPTGRMRHSGRCATAGAPVDDLGP